ncbi:ABC-type transport auxiliary lipoprotein family protein [Luteimonas sp. RIT-PG2_3]
MNMTPQPPEHPTRRAIQAATLRGAQRRATSRLQLCLLPLLLAGALSGCASLLGGGDERERSTIFALDPRVTPDPAWPSVDWQLSIATPTAPRMIDSFRILVRPNADELQVYKGANWAKTPPDMLQDTILRALEDSGKIKAVARQGSGIKAEYKLLIDIRRFEADYTAQGAATAQIEFTAKLVYNADQTVVASRTFDQTESAADMSAVALSDAFSRALTTTTIQIAQWLLATRPAIPDAMG